MNIRICTVKMTEDEAIIAIEALRRYAIVCDEYGHNPHLGLSTRGVFNDKAKTLRAIADAMENA